MFSCCSADADASGGTIVEAVPSLDSAAEVSPDDTAADEPTADKGKQEEEEEEPTQLTARVQEEEATDAEDAARRSKEADDAAAQEAAAQEAVPEKPEEPAADGDGLPLTFSDPEGASNYTVVFKTKPLCMNFDQSSKPVKVSKVFGQASQLGVSPGSALLKIGDTHVTNFDFRQVLEVIKDKIVPLAPEGLEIIFRDESGQDRSIIFPTKPLGMDFDQGKKPIRINKVHGAAQSLGVEAKWEVMKIAGTDVELLDFPKMLELLRSSVETLPTRD